MDIIHSKFQKGLFRIKDYSFDTTLDFWRDFRDGILKLCKVIECWVVPIDHQYQSEFLLVDYLKDFYNLKT